MPKPFSHDSYPNTHALAHTPPNIQAYLTPFAINRLKQLQQHACCIVIKKGGCYGYTANFTLQTGSILLTTQDDIEIYYSGPSMDGENLIIDYKTTLIRSGFVIESTQTSNCCCNKSFGRKLNKNNCSQNT